jgi:hypothetical protein
MIKDSNSETGITKKLIKFVKHWNNHSGKTIKSFQIEFFCVSYLNDAHDPTASWSQVIEGFFTWLGFQSSELSDDAQSRVSTAMIRSQKAREYELAEQSTDACKEWRKVFSSAFPTYSSSLSVKKSLELKYPSDEEEFIHERYPVRIDEGVSLSIQPKIRRNGFKDYLPFANYLTEYGVRNLPKSASLTFKANSNLGVKANYLWKIRNLSDEAEKGGGLRGAIIRGNSQTTREESTKYKGTHYIECYAIKAGVCVAMTRLFVPIGETE